MTRHAIVLITLLIAAVPTVAKAQNIGEGGPSRFPSSNTESQRAAAAALARSRAPVVKVTRSSPIGAVVARGRRNTATTRGRGAQVGECEYTASFLIEIAEGARELTITPRDADCTLVLENVEDRNVVEPGDVNVARQGPSPRGLWASLWALFFPTVAAQTLWVERSVYQHIYTCGVACGGGSDGLTALQGFLRYSNNTDYPRQVKMSNLTFDWYCIAGVRSTPVGYRSNCQPVLETPSAPMFPGNTGWRVMNPFILSREWGPSAVEVYSLTQAEFDWNLAGPQVQPRFYWHRLYVHTIGRPYPLSPQCFSTFDGMPVAGPLKLGCQVPGPEPLPY
jgi:hypothetical protein